MPAASELPNPHDADRRFLMEAVFRSDKGGGALVSDMAATGYELAVAADGHLAFRVRADGAAEVRSTRPVANGAWHHVMAETDLEAGVVRLYLDGRLDAEAPARLAGGCRNRADFFVGRGEAGFFAGELDFLRIALGTLRDANTTIEELFAWQFDGPFLRDFTGVKPTGRRRDAGAIEARP